MGRTGRRHAGAIAAGLAIVAVTLATRGIWLGDPVPDFDEQLYSLIGWRMTQGDLPYVDLWDRKPFGLFAIFAASHWLLGPGPIAYQIVATLFSLGGSWLVYLLARRLVDRVSATVAGALYAMLMSAYGSYSGQSEIFHTPLMLLMAWLVSDPDRPDAPRRAALAMLAGGLALQVKYTVLPQCLFLGGWVLLWRWRAGAGIARLVRSAAVFALLGLLPTILVGAFYASLGHFEAFWFANFESFFDRMPDPSGRWHSNFIAASLPIVLLTVFGLYAAIRLNPPREWRTYGLFAGWTLATLPSVFLPSTIYVYYFAALVPPAVLMAVPLIDRRSPGKLVPAAMLLIGAAYILNLPNRAQDSQDERKVEARLSAAIAPHVGRDGDCLYIFDGPAVLYRTTQTCLPSRFIYPDHLNNALEERAIGVDQTAELGRILHREPGVIVTADTPMTMQREANRETIGRVTRDSYRPLITVTLHDRQVTAWVRQDADD